MIRRTLVWAMVGGSLYGVQPVSAQRQAEPGGRIRVSPLAGRRVEGRLVRWIGDTVVVAPEYGPLVRFPVGQLRRIDVSRGRSTAAIKGMVLGTATGVALAGVITLMNPEGTGDLRQGQLLVAATAGLGIIGLGSGFFLGAFFTVENWERADLHPKLAVGNAGLRVSFRIGAPGGR